MGKDKDLRKQAFFALGTTLGAIVAIPLVIGGVLAHGFLIACAWNWLLVPTLGLRTLAIGHAFALSVVLSVAFGARDAVYKRDLRDRAGLSFGVWYGATLLLIYIAKHFV